MPTFVQRGIQNPEIVDLISPDRRTSQVVLTMIEDRPWGTDDEQLSQLEEKCNRYFAYLLDGFFAEQYPQYRGRSIRVQLDCVEPPPEEFLPLLQGVTGFARAHAMEFAIRVLRPSEIQEMEWELADRQTEVETT